MTDPALSTAPELTIVVPAHDEEGNVAPLIAEIQEAIIDAGIAAELVIVDDGSKDATLARLLEQAASRPWVRVLKRGKAMGQSAAMYAGIQAARGKFIATLDADLQNDPADLPAMLAKVRAGEADMAQGLRANRKDTIVRKVTSWVGRTTRKVMLNDRIRDTGCTTRVVRADIAKQFPLVFKGMHRFMPVYAGMVGARVIEMPVNHRPRVSGVAKYGIWDRALVGLYDCFVMRWMLKRYRNPACEVATPIPAPGSATGKGA